jgi:hypothetical protein
LTILIFILIIYNISLWVKTCFHYIKLKVYKISCRTFELQLPKESNVWSKNNLFHIPKRDTCIKMRSRGFQKYKCLV